MTMSEAGRLKEELSSEEVRLLRRQNEEFDKEIRRLKKELDCVLEVLDKFEQERCSNTNMEGQIHELKKRHSQEMEEVNDTFRESLCQKLNEMQCMEQRLAREMKTKCELEDKLNEACVALSEFKKCKEEFEKLKCAYESLDGCHKERLKELECVKKQFDISQQENIQMCHELDQLRCEAEQLRKTNMENLCKHTASMEQRSMIKKSVQELKKFTDEKAFMIKCYEKKIRHLESENEKLKCYRDQHISCLVQDTTDFTIENILYKKLVTFGIDALSVDELNELYDRVRCAMMKVTKKDSRVDITVDYSKIVDELCEKYSIPSGHQSILDNFPVRDNREAHKSSAGTARKNKNSSRKLINVKNASLPP